MGQEAFMKTETRCRWHSIWTWAALLGGGLFLSRCVIWALTGVDPFEQMR